MLLPCCFHLRLRSNPPLLPPPPFPAGYIVHGIKRRSSQLNTQRIDRFYEDPHVDRRHLVLHYGDLSDSTNLIRIVQQVQPGLWGAGAWCTALKWTAPAEAAPTGGACAGAAAPLAPAHHLCNHASAQRSSD